MKHALVLLLCLVALPALAQDAADYSGHYVLRGPAWSDPAGEDVEVELTLTRQADGSYQVTQRRSDTQETLKGEGRLVRDGRGLQVRYQAPASMAQQLHTLLGGKGQAASVEIRADYRLSPALRGTLWVRDAAGHVQQVEQYGQLAGAEAPGAKLALAPKPLQGGPHTLIPGPADPGLSSSGVAAVDTADGALLVPDRATFELLSRRDNVPGAMGVREVKFLVVGVDTPHPTLWFVNTKRHSFHYDFATRALGLPLTLQEFNARTYFRDDRSYLAGSIIAHDAYQWPDGSRGVYTVEFWPTDPVHAAHAALAFHAVQRGMPFTSDQVRYHAASETQRAIYTDERADFDARDVVSIDTEELYGSVTYSPLNLGEGYGVLRLVDGSDPRPATVRDVVIFVSIPNDLTHVAGVITEAPQTPLSHINLKAKQNDTPNAFIKNASQDPRIKPLLGKLVHYQVTPDGFVLEEADPDDAAAFLENLRPVDPQSPARDLSVTTIRPLHDVRSADVRSVGAKAANLGELQSFLPQGMVPDGFAVPFSFYQRYMETNGLYDRARAMLADPDFQSDPAVREARLRDLRRRIRRGTMPADLLAALGDMQASFPAGTGIRCRSSTNNEDLEGFNGAGLYDSYTHRPSEGHIEKSIKQVWSSLWNYRAFEEREFYRIDHFTAAMGVAVIPNFDDELANGVAVTKNIYDPNWPGFYVNVQVGESLVTNPDPGATPDEMLIARLGEHMEYEIQFVKHSSLLPADQPTVLSEAQTLLLRRQLERIQRHFRYVYGKANDSGFAMDVEFKITADGELAIKQARPWVD